MVDNNKPVRSYGSTLALPVIVQPGIFEILDVTPVPAGPASAPPLTIRFLPKILGWATLTTGIAASIVSKPNGSLIMFCHRIFPPIVRASLCGQVRQRFATLSEYNLSTVRENDSVEGVQVARETGPVVGQSPSTACTYLASRQLSPVPISTTRGTASGYTPSISRFTIGDTASNSPGGHSKTNSS